MPRSPLRSGGGILLCFVAARLLQLADCFLEAATPPVTHAQLLTLYVLSDWGGTGEAPFTTLDQLGAWPAPYSCTFLRIMVVCCCPARNSHPGEADSKMFLFLLSLSRSPWCGYGEDSGCPGRP